MKLKKMTAAFLAAAFVVSLTACRDSKKTSENSSGTGDTQSDSKSSANDAEGSEPQNDVTDESEFTYKYDSDYGGIVISDYIGESTEIKLPDTIEGKPLVAIGSYAFEGCTSLTSITIPDSVTMIGGYAFKNCTSLTNITIPDSVTEIGDSAFCNCRGLTSIAIPNSTTKIKDGSFSGCTSLTSITFPDSLIVIGHQAFFGCSSLTSINIPNNVTAISEFAFDRCENIQATYKGKTYDYEHIDDLYKAIKGN